MKRANTTATMKDVAHEAGVALGTVSKVVNGQPVGSSYKQRVEAAIQKLNYQVNSYAQGFKANKTYTVALLIPNIYEPYYAALTYHINLALLQRKYKMQLYSTDSDPEREQTYINMIQQNKVDGIIGLTCNPNLIIAEGTPFIALEHSIGSDIPCVVSDNYIGGQLAAEKLADFGCKKVALLYISSSSNTELKKRKSGFETECSTRNLHYEAQSISSSDSYDKFLPFLNKHISEGKLSFDGIFCASDHLAYYIIEILQKLNIKIPEDVQIIGYNGISFFKEGKYIYSTIVQPISKIAETCVEMLLLEKTPAKSLQICLPVTYSYGGTTIE